MKNMPRTMTNTKFKIDDHSKVVNVCEAIQGLIDDGVKSEKRETALRLMKMGFPSSRLRRRPSFPKTTC